MKISKITVGCDHAAYELKKKVIAHLEERGIEVIDVGTNSTESCDYPNFAHAVCKNVQDGVTELGILICGTGIGVSIAANSEPRCRNGSALGVVASAVSMGADDRGRRAISGVSSQPW